MIPLAVPTTNFMISQLLNWLEINPTQKRGKCQTCAHRVCSRFLDLAKQKTRHILQCQQHRSTDTVRTSQSASNVLDTEAEIG